MPKNAKESAPLLRVRPVNEVGTARFRVPQAKWALMSAQTKQDAWDHLFLNAIKGAMSQHPNGLFAYDFHELHPDSKDMLDPTQDPEVIGEVHVIIYEPLVKGGSVH